MKKLIIILIVVILLITGFGLFKFSEYIQLKYNCLSKINNAKSDIYVYIKPSTTESDILNLKKSIETLFEVASVVYISKEEALANFRKNHKDDTLVLEALNKLNENPMSASLNIKIKEVSHYESVTKFLSEISLSPGSIIDQINNLIDGRKSVSEKISSISFIDYIKSDSILKMCK